MGYYLTFDGFSGTGKGSVISWLEQELKSRRKKVIVVQDRDFDPLREIGAKMVDWCKANSVDHNVFLSSLFAAGYFITDQKMAPLFAKYDFILRDRSFISSLGYRTVSGQVSHAQVWSLHVEHLGLRVPDLAIIVDAWVETALGRVASRRQEDKGLGGKMSGDRWHMEMLRARFLQIPTMVPALPSLVVCNSGEYTENIEILYARLEKVGREIINRLISRGMLDE